MLKISFPACTKVMGPDSLYCGKWKKLSKSRHDLDLGPNTLDAQHTHTHTHTLTSTL